MSILCLAGCIAGLSAAAPGGDPDWSGARASVPRPQPSLTRSFRLLFFGSYAETPRDSLDPDDFLGLAGQSLTVELRAELGLLRLPGRLRVSPRARFIRSYAASEWETGVENDGLDLFVNAWEARFDPTDTLVLSMARGDLGWGSALLWSPSNPFGWVHRRQDPKQEAPGTDFLRGIWMPDNAWTVSLIANVAEGRRQSIEKFQAKTALKTDYLWYTGYASLILAARDATDPEIGAYAGSTVGDSWQLYVEGGSTFRSEALLIGLNYTAFDGWTLGGEWFFNGSGDSQTPMTTLVLERLGLEPANLQRDDQDDALNVEPADSAASPEQMAAWVRSKTSAWRFDQLPPLRQHYLLAHFAYAGWPRRITAFGSYVHSLDDRSGLCFIFLEYALGDRTSLFVSATRLHGNRDSEFGGLLADLYTAGIELAF